MQRALCLVLTLSLTATAQKLISASNSTTLLQSDNGLILSATNGTFHPYQYSITPLTTDAGAGSAKIVNVGRTFSPKLGWRMQALNAILTLFQNTNTAGDLVLVTETNAGNLDTEYIVMISCDTDSYSNNLPDTIFDTVIIRPPKSIILYSLEQNFCYYNTHPQNTQLEFTLVYTMESIGDSKEFINAINNVLPRSGSTLTIRSSTNTNNSTGGNDQPSNSPLGASPPTAVAMVILYAITGVITLLFVIIIIMGAVRAHRHPERYGPARFGRAGQSRAGGLARALVESIPLVKFQDPKPVLEHDIELADAPRTPTTSGTTDKPVTAAAPDSSPRHEESALAAVPREGSPVSGSSSPRANILDASADPATKEAREGELTCSICTEDFVAGEDLRALPCGHRFHQICLDPWLMNYGTSCPLCRISLGPNSSSQEDEATPGAQQASDIVVPTELLPVGQSTNTAERRRSTNRISRMLHFDRFSDMQFARPEERIMILRRIRQERGADAANPEVARPEAAASRGRQRNSTIANMDGIQEQTPTPSDQTAAAGFRSLFGRRPGAGQRNDSNATAPAGEAPEVNGGEQPQAATGRFNIFHRSSPNA
jgi:Ring finger domain